MTVWRCACVDVGVWMWVCGVWMQVCGCGCVDVDVGVWMRACGAERNDNFLLPFSQAPLFVQSRGDTKQY